MPKRHPPHISHSNRTQANKPTKKPFGKLVCFVRMRHFFIFAFVPRELWSSQYTKKRPRKCRIDGKNPYYISEIVAHCHTHKEHTPFETRSRKKLHRKRERGGAPSSKTKVHRKCYVQWNSSLFMNVPSKAVCDENGTRIRCERFSYRVYVFMSLLVVFFFLLCFALLLFVSLLYGSVFLIPCARLYYIIWVHVIGSPRQTESKYTYAVQRETDRDRERTREWVSEWM